MTGARCNSGVVAEGNEPRSSGLAYAAGPVPVGGPRRRNRRGHVGLPGGQRCHGGNEEGASAPLGPRVAEIFAWVKKGL